MKHFYKIFLLLFLISAKEQTFSQNFLGFQSSNYAGTYGLYTQPASVADNRLRFDVNIGGYSFDVSNNFLHYNGKRIGNGSFWKDLRQDSIVDRDTYSGKDSSLSKRYNAYFNQELYGPISFLTTITPKIGIAFTYRNRVLVNGDNFSGVIANGIYDSFKDSSIYNLPFNSDKSRIAANIYNEFALTYGQVVLDKGKHFLKVGVTGKLMQGIASAYLYNEKLNMQFNNDSTMNIASVQSQYGGSSVLSSFAGTNINQDVINADLFKNTFPSGWGADVGVVYEYRPKIAEYEYQSNGKTKRMMEKNKYKLRVGLSLLDIGHVSYKQYGGTGNFSVPKIDSIPLSFNAASLGSFNDSLNSFFNFTPNTGQYKMALPTAFSAQIDYNIWKNFYVNFMPYIAFQRPDKAQSIHTLSNFSITPRWENRHVSLAVPISIDNYYKTQVGFALRMPAIPVLPVNMMVGSSNLFSMFNRNEAQGLNFHVAFHIPLAFRKDKDIDEDGIKNKKDICPEVPGLKKFKGCPDKDEDGIEDSKDACPEVAGLEAFNGCPDKDADGVEDSKDECPEVAGKADFNGCPDKDDDGVSDKNDECMDVKGSKELKGCPDKDSDGIADKDDNCPDEKGTTKFKGCADKDNDGIMDKEDTCPDEKGLPAFKGCPDTDGDGVADKEDNCPKIAGLVQDKGCPDTDKDGILDNVDKCPNIPGVVENKGCPQEVGDKDKDGILDDKDKCPNDAGLAQFDGCPDTDKDGIQDNKDKCPKVAGVAQFDGCPDTDKDGVQDSKDDCPNTFGLAKFAGCPDTDNDEVEDENDACPTVFGAIQTGGCPDKDGDGIFDNVDVCPSVPGVIENKGCPLPPPIEIRTAFEAIEFESGKSTLKSVSFEGLDKVVNYLLANPQIRLSMGGHTDNVGDPLANIVLSARRVEAVRDYFVSRGIAYNRFEIEGYGDTKPIADNKTAVGRQKNRRVEVQILK